MNAYCKWAEWVPAKSSPEDIAIGAKPWTRVKRDTSGKVFCWTTGSYDTREEAQAMCDRRNAEDRTGVCIAA